MKPSHVGNRAVVKSVDLVVLATVLASLAVFAWTPPAHADLYTKMFDKKENFGGVLAPPSLPSGAAATYVYVGAPELAGGYRFGVGGLELEGRVTFNYVLVSLGFEALGKLPLL